VEEEAVRQKMDATLCWTLLGLVWFGHLDGVGALIDYLCVLAMSYVSLSTDAWLQPNHEKNVAPLATAFSMTIVLTICLNLCHKKKMPIDLPIVLSIGLLLVVTLPWHAFLFIYPPAVNNIAISKDIFGFNFGSNIGNCFYLTIVSASIHLLHLHWCVLIVFMIYWFFRPLMLSYVFAVLSTDNLGDSLEARVLQAAVDQALDTTNRPPSYREIWLRYAETDFLLMGHYIIYAIYYAMFGHHGVIMCYYYMHVFVCKPYQFPISGILGSLLLTAGSLTLYIIGSFITNRVILA
jgi:hypothetical protein